jgi:hypothetical protein
MPPPGIGERHKAGITAWPKPLPLARSLEDRSTGPSGRLAIGLPSRSRCRPRGARRLIGWVQPQPRCARRWRPHRRVPPSSRQGLPPHVDVGHVRNWGIKRHPASVSIAAAFDPKLPLLASNRSRCDSGTHRVLMRPLPCLGRTGRAWAGAAVQLRPVEACGHPDLDRWRRGLLAGHAVELPGRGCAGHSSIAFPPAAVIRRRTASTGPAPALRSPCTSPR